MKRSFEQEIITDETFSLTPGDGASGGGGKKRRMRDKNKQLRKRTNSSKSTKTYVYNANVTTTITVSFSREGKWDAIRFGEGSTTFEVQTTYRASFRTRNKLQTGKK